jgi:hypothetical protein
MKTYRVPRPTPKSTRDESTFDRFLLLLGPLALVLLQSSMFQILKLLLLVIGPHLETQSCQECSREEYIRYIERYSNGLSMRRSEFLELRDVSRRGERVGQEEVLREFGDHQEDVLDPGDENEIEQLERPRRDLVAN